MYTIRDIPLTSVIIGRQPLAKSLAPPMSTHTYFNIRLALAEKPLTVMRIDGGAKSIGSPAQKLLSMPSLLVWKKSATL